jgi:DNA-binding MarR family transcriptional regulator
MSNHRPFFPAWLDDASLSPVQFRILAHLWRRADSSGACWPSGPSIAATCKINRDSVWPAIAILEQRGLLHRSKAFRNSNRYQLRVGGNEGATETKPAEKEGLQSAESEGLHPAEKEGRQSAEKEGCKGTPPKELHRRNSNEGTPRGDASIDGLNFADWFKGTLPESINLAKNWRTSFAKAYDDLVRLDGLKADSIRKVSEWARSSEFWSSNFMSPAKLRKRNRDGIRYFDVFSERMKAVPTPAAAGTASRPALNLGRRGITNGYNERTDF